MTGRTGFDWEAARQRVAALGAALAEPTRDPASLERVFAARAEALARRGAVERATSAGAGYLVVRAGGEACGLRLAETVGVVRISALARLPGVSDELAGALAEQGRIWPVLDLARLLGRAPDEAGLQFGVLLRRGRRRCALGVAALEGLRDLAIPATGESTDAPSRYVRAIADDVSVIDVAGTLDHPLLGKESET